MAGTSPNEMDRLIGARIRARREMLGFSQVYVANIVSTSAAQMSKIERGTNHVSAGNLFKIAKCLDVDIYYFFETVLSWLTGPGFSEETNDWAPKNMVLEDSRRIAAIMRDLPADVRTRIVDFAQTHAREHAGACEPGVGP